MYCKLGKDYTQVEGGSSYLFFFSDVWVSNTSQFLFIKKLTSWLEECVSGVQTLFWKGLIEFRVIFINLESEEAPFKLTDLTHHWIPRVMKIPAWIGTQWLWWTVWCFHFVCSSRWWNSNVFQSSLSLSIQAGLGRTQMKNWPPLQLLFQTELCLYVGQVGAFGKRVWLCWME